MSARISLRHGLRVLVALAMGGTLEVLSDNDSINQNVLLAAMTCLLLAYLFSEIRRVRLDQPQSWLINPAVMTSLVTFGISFGLTNVIYFLPAETLEPVGLTPYVSHSMVKLMWLVLLASIAMWVGYRSAIGNKISAKLAHGARRRWIRSAPKPHRFAVPCLALLALGARLLQLHFGIFGYASSYANLMAMGKFTQYLSMGASLGSLSLVLAALTYYRHSGSRYFRLLLMAILVIEVGFGLLSGFKSQVAMPFVIVGVCYYLKRGRIPVAWVVGFALAIALAYAVIQPYRNIRNSQYAGSGNSVAAIASSMASAQQEPDSESYTNGPTWLNLLARNSLLYVGSLGIRYQDAGRELPAGSPEFLKNLLMAPAYAFLPRALFPDKPSGTLGLWYTHVVMGKPLMSATDATPFTYLYFAGGIVAIVGFFMMLGVYQRVIWLLLKPTETVAGALVFLVLLTTIAQISSSVDGMVIQIFRTIPILLVMQLLLFPRHAREQRPPRTPKFARNAMIDANLVPNARMFDDAPHHGPVTRRSTAAGHPKA